MYIWLFTTDDTNRVCLRDPPDGMDYINASYVDVSSHPDKSNNGKDRSRNLVFNPFQVFIDYRRHVKFFKL